MRVGVPARRGLTDEGTFLIPLDENGVDSHTGPAIEIAASVDLACFMLLMLLDCLAADSGRLRSLFARGR
jgi:hypothetical protein